MSVRISTAARNDGIDGVADQIDVGAGTAVLQLRTGARPANLGDAAAGTLLAEFDLPNPCFGAGGAVVAGRADAEAIADTTGEADGVVGHARVLDRDGDPVLDTDSISTDGSGEVDLNTATINTGVTVSINFWRITLPAE